MKVIEKLFINYLQIPCDQYVNKYLAAKSVLEITEKGQSKRLDRVNALRDKIHPNMPISVFKAEKFLKSPENTLMWRVDRVDIKLNKREGDDYRLAEYLGDFLDRVNTEVVDSMAAYNSDRSRGAGGSTIIET